MPDGVRLSARLWLPNGASSCPVPAILEYIPYRKRDMVRERDERNHPFFAENGYACLRVDMRGSGDSEGLMSDMYRDEELADARAVIDWIAGQDWCDGSVGMFGTSWGGTASLQAATLGHPALKAVIAVCATHDRYHDDIHRMGGLVLTDTFEWGATLPAILALPPSRDVADGDWWGMWRRRLDGLAFPVEHWVAEEERGAYWRRGSITDSVDRISCPILAVGGWSDRYSNSVLSLLEQAPDRVWGIVGPWGHHYPDVASPGPGIGFQREALGWWNHWLRGESDEKPTPWPRLRAWLRRFDPPSDTLAQRNGDWFQLEGPPSRQTRSVELRPVDGALSARMPKCEDWASLPTDPSVGMASGDTGYFGRLGGLPLDQAVDDARSLVRDGAPLEESLVLVGAPVLELVVASDQPLGQIAVRLCDVAPNGEVARVSYGVLNLALSKDFTECRPLKPGEHRRIRVRMHTTAYRFAVGHRIRLSLSSGYWPLVWPSLEPTNARVCLSKTTLLLPIMDAPPMGLHRPFAPIETHPRENAHEAVSRSALRRIGFEEVDGTLVSGWHQPFSSSRSLTTGTVFGYETKSVQKLNPADRLSATIDVSHRLVCERTDGTAEVESRLRAWASKEKFFIEGAVRVRWENETIHSTDWAPVIPRRSC